MERQEIYASMASSLGNCNWKTGLLAFYACKEVSKEFALLKVMDGSTTLKLTHFFYKLMPTHSFLNAVRLPN